MWWEYVLEVVVYLTPHCRAADDLNPVSYPSPRVFLEDLFRRAVEPLRRVQKDGRAIIPVLFAPPLDGKYEGPEGRPTPAPYRKKDNVHSVTALFVDIDQWSREHFDGWLARIRERGLAFVAYPTHSYGKKPGVCYRVVFTFTEPVVIGSADRWAGYLWPALMRFIELDPKAAVSADDKCCDASRLYYLPSWSPNNTTPRPPPQSNLDGSAIDVQAVLGRLLTLPFSAYVPIKRSLKPSETTQPVDRVDLFKRLRKRFRAAAYLQVIGQADTGALLVLNGQRHDAILKLTEAVSRIAKEAEDSEDLVEAVAGDSLRKMAEAEPSRDWHREAVRALENVRDPAVFESWERRAKEKERADYRAWIAFVRSTATVSQ